MDCPELSVSRIEWPTLALGAVIYAMFFGLTWFYALLPWPVVVIGGGVVVAWHGSFQHELIHGHPTRVARLNRALGLPGLALFLPYDRYAALHIAHHRDDVLTDPLEDPETYYWTAASWMALPIWARAIVTASSCLAGRLVFGPIWMIARFLQAEVGRWRRNEPGVRRAWAWHLPVAALILGWVWGICGIDPAHYALMFVLPGTSLLMIRSFAEHRAAPDADRRTAVVEQAGLFGLLFLFNNLHAAHHERPGIPWYRLPRWYRGERERLLQKNGGLIYRGYAEVMKRYLLHHHDQIVHPYRP